MFYTINIDADHDNIIQTMLGDKIIVIPIFIPDTLFSNMESEFSNSSLKRDRDEGCKDGPLGEQPDDELFNLLKPSSNHLLPSSPAALDRCQDPVKT